MANEFQPSREFREQPGVGGRARDLGQAHDRGLQHTVQRRVFGEFVETAGQHVGASSERRDLTDDVQASSA